MSSLSSSSSSSVVVVVEEEEEEDVVFVDVVVVVLSADRRAADGEDPAAGRALSMDSVPATTRYTVPAALATRSAVFLTPQRSHYTYKN